MFPQRGSSRARLPGPGMRWRRFPGYWTGYRGSGASGFQTPDSISAFCTKGPRWGIRPYWVPPGFSGGPLYTEHYADEKARCTFIEIGCWTKEVVADANLAGSLLGVNSSQAGGL